MKKYLIALTAVLLLSLAYIKYQPVVTYLSGKLEAKLSRGKISGHSVYKLPVPFHRQEHSLSCEIAALKMALAGVGVDVPESELISHLPFDPTPRQSGVWGDPYKAFVGDIDGKMFSTGYGVYWQPIADVGLKYKRTEVLENGTIEQLIDHLNQGHPIVVWGYYGRGNRSTWTTPEGRRIEGVNGEHARTLIGYTGDSSNPESLIILDPIYGELYWDVPKFESNWNALSKGAVVVYPHPRWVKAFSSPVVWEVSPDGLSKHALAMDWETFVAQGGVGNAIAVVSDGWLQSLTEGPVIKTLNSLSSP